MFGYIYVIRMLAFEDKWACPYKIGKSTSIPRRVSELGIILPYPIELVHVVETENMNVLERHIQNMFVEFHTQGEWFELSQEAIEWFCSVWTKDRLAELSKAIS